MQTNDDFDCGHKAFSDGLDISQNPHLKLTHSRRLWEAGWIEAKDKAQGNKAFIDGKEAYSRGEALDTNPHWKQSHLHKKWAEGWDENNKKNMHFMLAM